MTRFWIVIPAGIVSVCMVLIVLALGVGAEMPGEGQLSFSSTREGDQEIYLLDISRSILLNLTKTPQNELQAVWSPDGTQIAYVSDRTGGSDIYTQTVACRGLFAACSSQTRRITTNSARDYDPAWSPDGAHIVFSTDRYGYAEIFLTAIAGGVPKRLTNNDSLDLNPAWSPDGKQIVFSSNQDHQPSQVDLYVMDADGSNQQRILENPGTNFSADWSPDGRSIVYGTFVGGSNRQLALLDLETGFSSPLLDDRANDDTPAWSPDGESLAFIAYPEAGNSEIYMTRLDCIGGREVCARRLTFSYGLDTNPRWRPTG